MEQMLPVLFEGSQYAVRNLIGDTLILKTFDPDTLRDFYHDWYRTDLQAIAVVGDIDVDAVEKKVKEIFSSIPAVENAAPRPENPLVPKQGTKYLLVTDPEASQTSVSMFTIDAEPDLRARDTDYIRDGFVVSLMNSMMDNRFDEIVQKGTPPFITGMLNYGSFNARNYNALMLSASVREDEESQGLRSCTDRVRKSPQVRIHGR